MSETMKILADENIPFVREAFAQLGEVRTCAGRAMDAAALGDAELLLVRSVTKVGPELLQQSAVRFVGTATAGTDHVDEEYLQQAGIEFASAPGSNAESVAQYVIAGLLAIAEKEGCELRGKTIGIVGVGHVGSRVARNARALGMRVLLNDPPLSRITGDSCFVPLEQLVDADFLTLHVPLNPSGVDRTVHMVDGALLRRMKPTSWLLNTSRGSVVDNSALLAALQQGASAGAVLDVWEGEPHISADLLERVLIGTPHIAGYSFDGKVRGTEMVYASACRFLQRAACWNASESLPAADVPTIQLKGEHANQTEVLQQVVKPIYDILADDAQLRELLSLPAERWAKRFDELRKEYPRRREFSNTTVVLDERDEQWAEALRELQFRVECSAARGFAAQ